MGKTIRFNGQDSYESACSKYPSAQRDLVRQFSRNHRLTPGVLRRMDTMVSAGQMSDATASAIIYAIHRSLRTGR